MSRGTREDSPETSNHESCRGKKRKKCNLINVKEVIKNYISRHKNKSEYSSLRKTRCTKEDSPETSTPKTKRHKTNSDQKSSKKTRCTKEDRAETSTPKTKRHTTNSDHKSSTETRCTKEDRAESSTPKTKKHETNSDHNSSMETRCTEEDSPETTTPKTKRHETNSDHNSLTKTRCTEEDSPETSTPKTKRHKKKSDHKSSTNTRCTEEDNSETSTQKTKRHMKSEATKNQLCMEDVRGRDKCRKQLYRDNMSPDEKKKYRHKAAMRMRELREKRKIEGYAKPELTKSEKHKQRCIWKKQKREQRSKMTEEMKAEKKKKALVKKVKSLSASDFAELLSQAATPRKKKEMESRGYNVCSPKLAEKTKIAFQLSENVKGTVALLKKKRDKLSRGKLKVIASCVARKKNNINSVKLRRELMMKWHTWRKYSTLDVESTWDDIMARRKRSDTTNDDKIAQVETFYKETSTPMPLQRMAGKFVLTGSLKNVHKEYLERNTSTMSLSTFQRLRPKEILTADMNKFSCCVCEYCLNIVYKVSDSFILR